MAKIKIRIRRKKDGTPRYVAFPMQKIIRIQDGVHIACAGCIPDAKKIIEFARTLRWPNPTTPTAPKVIRRPLISKMRRYREDNVPNLEYIIVGNGFQFGIGARMPTPVGPVQVIGSGV